LIISRKICWCEDQGVFFSLVQLPAGASMERTKAVLDRTRAHLLDAEKDNIESVLTVAGFSFAGSGQNAGIVFVKLKDWSLRKAPGRDANAIIGRTMGFLMGIKEANAFAFSLPPIPELGTASGFDFYLQADAPFRMTPEDLKLWHVRNSHGDMVPFSAFASTRWTYGSPRLERYNGSPAVNIVGQAAAGMSTGDAMASIERLIAQLPAGVGIEWTGLSLQERMAGDQAPALYALSILIVFLCLAALYESWSIPFSVIMVVPLGVLGAVIAAVLYGLSNDVYFQVALLTTTEALSHD
jgi:multidrug efflux pump subunit AcrB